MENISFAQPDYAVKELVEIDLPSQEPTGSEVLVEITHAGVCHSDLHLREGGYDLGSAGWMSMLDRGVTYPLVLGHEIAGVVSAVGPDVKDRKVGEAVVVYPWLGCGECEVCRAGDENLCVNGSRTLGVTRPGGYAHFASVPHEKYVVPLDGVDPAWAATLACSGLTAISAAEHVTGLKIIGTDSPVAVIGAGGVGLMCVAALAAAGMTDITVLDRSDANFERAKELGAARCAVTTDATTAGDVRRAVGEQPMAIIDVVNSGTTMKLAYDSLRKGGRLVTVGLFGGEAILPVATLSLTQKSIVGNYVGGIRHLHTALELAREGRLPRIPIATAPMTLESVQQALDGLEAGTSRGRTVLTH